ncbi:MAG: hypothetical protein ACM3PY_14650 [Omnitrophica WOR_2 bacterium]
MDMLAGLLSSERLTISLLIVLLLLTLIASACAPNASTISPAATGTPAVTPAQGGGMVTKEHSPAVEAARKALSEKLNIPADQIQYVSADLTQFTDGCLGLGKPDEGCLQEITPGYIVKFEVKGQTYEIHTDEMGTNVRIKE